MRLEFPTAGSCNGPLTGSGASSGNTADGRGLWSVVCGLWSVVCGLWSVVCGLSICGLYCGRVDPDGCQFMKMIQKLTRVLAFLVVVAQFSLPVVATVVEQKPEVVAGEATQRVLTVLRENRKVFEKEPQKYYAAVDEALHSVIAFDRIARGVMGKFSRQATLEQRQTFVRTFRSSLIEFYGKAVMMLDSSRLKLSHVDPVTEEQLTAYQHREVRSIPVNLTVSSDSREYSLSYSMIQDDGQWKARNILVEGINIGVQFRNQFTHAMQKYRNVGEVIDNWALVMKGQVNADPEA